MSGTSKYRRAINVALIGALATILVALIKTFTNTEKLLPNKTSNSNKNNSSIINSKIGDNNQINSNNNFNNYFLEIPKKHIPNKIFSLEKESIKYVLVTIVLNTINSNDSLIINDKLADLVENSPNFKIVRLKSNSSYTLKIGSCINNFYVDDHNKRITPCL